MYVCVNNSLPHSHCVYHTDGGMISKCHIWTYYLLHFYISLQYMESRFINEALFDTLFVLYGTVVCRSGSFIRPHYQDPKISLLCKLPTYI